MNFAKFHSINLAEIMVAVNGHSKKLIVAYFTVVFTDTQFILDNNYPLYRNYVELYSVNNQHVFFDDLPTNFGIPDSFHWG